LGDASLTGDALSKAWIPAFAGMTSVFSSGLHISVSWIPAYAGMTSVTCVTSAACPSAGKGMTACHDVIPAKAGIHAFL